MKKARESRRNVGFSKRVSDLLLDMLVFERAKSTVNKLNPQENYQKIRKNIGITELYFGLGLQ